MNPEMMKAPHIVSGVSAGSLIAAGIATNTNLNNMYNDVSHAVLAPRIGPCGAMNKAVHLYTGSTAFLYSNAHLKKFIDGRFVSKSVNHTLRVYAAKASTLKQQMFQSTIGTHTDTNALLASCSIPGVFPSVNINNEAFIDGGAESNFPLYDIQQSLSNPAVKHLFVFATHPWDMRACRSRATALTSTKSILATLATNYMHAAAYVDDIHALNMLQLTEPPDGPFVARYCRENGNAKLLDVVTKTSEPTHMREFDMAALCYAPTVKEYMELNSESINLTTPWRKRLSVTDCMFNAGKQGAVSLNHVAIKAGVVTPPKLVL
tara:strand:+ start:25527 stop:26486 length:960 start_codon:yes stop_codon:yes gene_type:complete